jgi:RES domain-containing protein
MHTYRIGQTKYARDRIGSGIDARWNLRGQYVIYTGGSLALSCLEKLAHTPGTSLYSGDFSVTMFEIPNEFEIIEIGVNELTGINPDWHKVINYPITQKLGNQWLQNHATAVLKVPSAIIDMEYNYLLNPSHPDFEKIKIIGVSKFTFDPRLKVY